MSESNKLIIPEIVGNDIEIPEPPRQKQISTLVDYDKRGRIVVNKLPDNLSFGDVIVGDQFGNAKIFGLSGEHKGTILELGKKIESAPPLIAPTKLLKLNNEER